MRKRGNPVFLVIGIFFSLMAGFVLVKMTRYSAYDQNLHPISGGQPPKAAGSQPENASVTAADAASASLPAQNDTTTQWMTFGGMDLLADRVGMTFSMRCPSGTKVEIPPIEIIAWYPGVFEDGEFGIGKQLAVAWEHLGYEGLWVHSGWDFWQERSPATDLQYFIETNEINEVQPLKVMGAKMNDCLLGSTVSVYQESTVKQGVVTAAVRIPAEQLDELSRHTMDLVPYLGSAYPESGFLDIEPDAMLLYFCGRAAVDELTDQNADYWTQTRFVIAITPVE